MPRTFVDTNILAYLFDSAAPAKQEAATVALSTGRDFVVSTQVLLELYNVLTRTLRPIYSPTQARAAVKRVADYGTVNTDRRLVEKGMAVADKHQLSIWDAMMVAAAQEAGCGELWTEDLTEGSVLLGVRIVNPLL